VHALFLVHLDRGQLQPEGLAVELDRLLQVGHRDADVVDGGDPGCWLLRHDIESKHEAQL
jgi:hypothetical protein